MLNVKKQYALEQPSAILLDCGWQMGQ